MKETRKTVYYCDHCRKHGLSRYAMEQHERKCTMNPERTCGWGGPHRLDFPALAEAIRTRVPLTKDDIAWLHQEVDGCPPCMLAALRQSGVPGYHWNGSDRIFDYAEIVAETRAEERDEYARTVGW